MSASAGAASPRAVTRGESPPVGFPALPVSIDYLNITISAKPEQVVDFALSVLNARSAVQRNSGLHGYDRSIDVEGFAKIAHGGESQRGTVLLSINGEGCARVGSWLRVHDFIKQHGGKITRCDVCADDHNSRLLSIRKALNAYRCGAFVNGGRPPKAELIDDLGSRAGRTFYVGSRAGGKLARIYEKGKQLGDKASRWIRGEVEFHNKDRVIPLDILLDPVRYLAGSFPYFAAMSFIVEKIRTVKAVADASVAAVTRWLKEAGGAALNAVYVTCGRDSEKTIEALRREAVPRRLQWCRELLQ
jgi:phage replication initiation protein